MAWHHFYYWRHFYYPNRIEAREKKAPATAPVIRQASVAARRLHQDKNPKKADKVVYIHPLTNP